MPSQLICSSWSPYLLNQPVLLAGQHLQHVELHQSLCSKSLQSPKNELSLMQQAPLHLRPSEPQAQSAELHGHQLARYILRGVPAFRQKGQRPCGRCLAHLLHTVCPHGIKAVSMLLVRQTWQTQAVWAFSAASSASSMACNTPRHIRGKVHNQLLMTMHLARLITR